MKKLRFHKHTTEYRAYKHTSFNMEIMGRTTLRLSFHIKYSYHDRGFWFGLRPEIEIHRQADKVAAFFAEMREKGQRSYECASCKREEDGPLGMGWIEGWDKIRSHLDVCPECQAKYTLKELLKNCYSESK